MTDLILASKIQPQHLDRLAVVYVRQSHPQQQIDHPESARAQRRLRERILQWGWPEHRIHMLEGDSGKSATTTVGRDEYAWLLEEVMLGHVGLVAGFQISRLAREDEAICRLIKVCSAFDTLIADLDGLYHPVDFNDRLLLNIKGLIASMELHQIQQRMQHGRLEKARRGEWLGPPPRGYLLGANQKLIFDANEQVQQAVRQVFDQFDRLGSISALLRYFNENELLLPLRVDTPEEKNVLVWRSPHRESVRNMLRNPAYAGAFTWARRPIDPRRAIAGRRGTGRGERKPENCDVFLRDNHPAYVDWERFQRNLQRLSSHRRRGPEPSAKRETASLLAGRVFCGRCGARMQTRYSPQLRYVCARWALDYGQRACGSLEGEPIEQLATEQILAALEPASLELSLAAADDIESERAELDRTWKLRLEQARYEADYAFREYRNVEPEHRLVARNLERLWEEALQAEQQLQEEYDRFCASQPMSLSPAERESILALSSNLPQLWNAPSIDVAEKRRVVQLLIEKVVVTISENERVGVDLHWMGGAVTRHEVIRSVQRWSQLSTHEAILSCIEEMSSQGCTGVEIAASLNASGYRTCRGKLFSSATLRQLRSRGGR